MIGARDCEITAPIDIADARGRLIREAVGWARQPIFGCTLAPGLTRVHRWNHWCFTAPGQVLQVTVADVGFLGLAIVSFTDFGRRLPVERIHLRPGGLPTAMPETPRDDLVLSARRLELEMVGRGEQMQVRADARTLLGSRLRVNLTVDRPLAHETLNVLVPFDDERFQFTSKQQALPVRGTVRLDSREYEFGAEAVACLDFGRGRWPSRIEWYWAFASGPGLGFNLGGKWTDGTGVTENAVVIDGRLRKISEDVEFTRDPWRVRSRGSGAVDLTFTPQRERKVKLPLLVASAHLHQCFGVFNGTAAGVTVENLQGSAEFFRGHW